MSKDTAVYNARVMHEYYQTNVTPQRAEEIVLDILASKDEELKREEIIQLFQQKQKCKDLDVGDIVTGALAQLVKHKKIVRVSQGIYKTI